MQFDKYFLKNTNIQGSKNNIPCQKGVFISLFYVLFSNYLAGFSHQQGKIGIKTGYKRG